MHELSVTESILEITLRHAKEANAVRVTDVHLVIGQFSSFVGESIQFYWDILSKETICAGAVLHFERVPAKFHCSTCARSFVLSGELVACPHCDGVQIELLAGDEFFLRDIEIEE